MYVCMYVCVYLFIYFQENQFLLNNIFLLLHSKNNGAVQH